jgi:RNA polymerase sigma-70 factor, ECF subfamily
MVWPVDPLTRLARRAGAGEEGALDSFVDAAYEHVWRLCSVLVDAQTADDLAQETFVRAVRTLPRFRGDSSARTWLLAVARHVCLDELRSRTRRRRRDHTLATSWAVERTDHADASQASAVTDLLAQLEPDRRAAFVLTALLGLSYEEASKVCECPAGTIRSRVARARAELVEMVGPNGIDHRAARRSPSA